MYDSHSHANLSYFSISNDSILGRWPMIPIPMLNYPILSYPMILNATPPPPSTHRAGSPFIITQHELLLNNLIRWIISYHFVFSVFYFHVYLYVYQYTHLSSVSPVSYIKDFYSPFLLYFYFYFRFHFYLFQYPTYFLLHLKLRIEIKISSQFNPS